MNISPETARFSAKYAGEPIYKLYTNINQSGPVAIQSFGHDTGQPLCEGL